MELFVFFLLVVLRVLVFFMVLVGLVYLFDYGGLYGLSFFFGFLFIGVINLYIFFFIKFLELGLELRFMFLVNE